MEEGVEGMCWPSASPSASLSLWFPVWASSQRRWASAECCACHFAPVPPPAVKEQRQCITVNTTQMFYIECSFATTHITFLWWCWRPLPSVLFFSNVKLRTSTEGFWASRWSHHPNTPAGSSPSSYWCLLVEAQPAFWTHSTGIPEQTSAFPEPGSSSSSQKWFRPASMITWRDFSRRGLFNLCLVVITPQSVSWCNNTLYTATLSWLVFSCPVICLFRSSMSLSKERIKPSSLCRSCFSLSMSRHLSSTCRWRL